MPRIRAASVPAHRALMLTKILDAFGDLVHERGYAELTLAEVAARAGIARNTIYNYVGDKEALLMAYIDRSVERFIDDVRAQLATLPDAPSRLRALVRHQMHQFLEEPGAGSDAGMVDSSMLGPGGHGALVDRFRPLHRLLAEIITEGVAEGAFRAVDLDRTVPMAFAVIGAERMPVGSGEHDPDVAADEVAEFVLRALAP